VLVWFVSRSSLPLDVIARATSRGITGVSMPVRLDTEIRCRLSGLCLTPRPDRKLAPVYVMVAMVPCDRSVVGQPHIHSVVSGAISGCDQAVATQLVVGCRQN